MLQRTIKVLTASGRRALKADCCLIGEQYYIKNEEAVKIGMTWYSKDSSDIFFDHGTASWRRRRGVNILKGVVGYDGRIPKMGMFAANPTENITVYEVGTDGMHKKSTIYMNRDLIKNKDIHYNRSLAVYEDISKITDPSIRKAEEMICKTMGRGIYNYSFPQEYSSSHHMEMFTKYTRDMRINNPINTSDVSEFGKYSFGLEFETSKGKLSQDDCFKLGLIPLRDGSIGGIEYTTIPMKGAEGFNLLINQIKALQENTAFDKECSLHLHLGGLPIDYKQIWALYKLLLIIEGNVTQIFPPFAFQTSRFKSSKKDYCTFLRKCSTFEDLYYYASGGNLRFTGCLTSPHPQDREDRQKWNIHARYHWANLINLMFKGTGKTTEFRVHAPTFNIQKIINWMFICAAILQYAEKKKDFLLRCTPSTTCITLKEIVSEIYSNRISSQLIKYMEDRAAFFYLLNNKYQDPAGLLDMDLDNNQDFGTNLITNVR